MSKKDLQKLPEYIRLEAKRISAYNKKLDIDYTHALSKLAIVCGAVAISIIFVIKLT